MDWKRIALAATVAGTFAAAPFAQADAHRYHRGVGVWPFVAGAAVLGTAAAIATAPLRAPYYYYPPPAYYPAPAYYAPSYYAPGYYPPPYSAGY